MTRENENRKDVKEKKDKKKRVGGIAAFSLLIALFDRLGEMIYDTVINGFFGNLFTSYTKVRELFKNSLFGKKVFNNTGIRRFFRRIRRFLSRNLDSCFSLSFASQAINKLCSFPLQYYGNIGLFFGIYSVVVYFVKFFVPNIEPSDISHLYVGIFTAVSSLPLVFSRISLASSIKSSVFGRAIFKHTFGFSDESFDSKKNVSHGKGNLMLLLGLLLGLSTIFVHPLAIIFIALTATVLILIASAPEIGVLLTIAILPFLSFFESPSAILSLLVIITAFFYVIKVIRGKRVFKLEIADFTVLLFAIMILLSSLYSAGGEMSALSAEMSFILMIGYFLFVNLMRTEKWIKRCIVALVSSASIVAIIGIVEFVFGGKSTKWLDQSFHEVIKTRVVSLFENPNILAMFLVMIFPFLLALAIRSKERNAKFLTRTLIVIFILCIIFTWSRAAWLAMLIGLLVFAILYTRKSFRIFGVAVLVAPIAPMIIPSGILDRFLSISNLTDSSIAYRMYTWKGTLGAIGDYWFTGIGYGDAAFQTVYPAYSYSGIEASPHSHSLILQILLGLGIVGLIIFIAAIFFNFQKSLEYIKLNRTSSSRVYVIASVVSLLSALFIGIFDYVWYNQRIFYLFWIVMAIGCAFVRVGNYEQTRRSEIEPY